MDQQLKQRLVGGTVLSLLAVLFLPLAFDERIEPIEVDTVKTRTSSSVVAEAENRGSIREMPINKKKDPDKPGLDKRLLPVKRKPVRGDQPAWVIQVGSFSAADNASELRSKLRRAGFSAIVEDSKESKGMIYRVRMGPFFSRAEAESALQQLQSKLGLKAIILSLPKTSP